MKMIDAFRAGLARTMRFKKYIIVAYLLNLLLASVLGSALYVDLRRDIGRSLAGEQLRDSFDPLWFQHYASNARGIASTFSPAVTGIGAVFEGLDDFVRGGLLRQHPLVAAAGVLYLLLWTLLSAGFIAAYAQGAGPVSFAGEAARFFVRFLLLAAMAGVLYWLIFATLLPWLGDRVEALNRETIDERVHFAWVAAKYLLVWALIWLVNLLLDYSKILTVLRNERNVLKAPIAAAGLVFRHAGKTIGLYALIGWCWLVLMLFYWLVAPGAGQSTWLGIVGAFVIAQVYLLLRIWNRCLFFAGQTALAQGVGMKL